MLKKIGERNYMFKAVKRDVWYLLPTIKIYKEEYLIFSDAFICELSFLNFCFHVSKLMPKKKTEKSFFDDEITMKG